MERVICIKCKYEYVIDGDAKLCPNCCMIINHNEEEMINLAKLMKIAYHNTDNLLDAITSVRNELPTASVGLLEAMWFAYDA